MCVIHPIAWLGRDRLDGRCAPLWKAAVTTGLAAVFGLAFLVRAVFGLVFLVRVVFGLVFLVHEAQKPRAQFEGINFRRLLWLDLEQPLDAGRTNLRAKVLNRDDVFDGQPFAEPPLSGDDVCGGLRLGTREHRPVTLPRCCRGGS